MRTASKNKIRILVLVAACCVLLFIGAGLARKPPQGTGRNPESSTIYTVQERDTRETVEITGNIEARETVDLGFARDGRIRGILVAEGDRVARGQILAELDYSTQLYAISSVESAIARTRISGSSRDLADLELKLEAEKEQLTTYRIISTIPGRVSDVEGSPGEVYQMGKAESSYVIRVIDDSSLIAEVEIDEIDAPLIRIGQKVEFQFDALPNLDITGTVTSLPIEAVVDSSGIARVKTKLSVDNPPPQLLSGYSFTALIVVEDTPPVLVIDQRALTESADGVFSATVLLQDGSREQRDVVAERLGDGTLCVKSGLMEGDRVAGPGTPSDGKSVRNPLDLLGLKAPERPEGGPGGRE